MYKIFVLTLLSCFLRSTLAFVCQARVGENFVCQLNAYDYFDTEGGSTAAVRFVPSVVGRPDLAHWMRFFQEDYTKSAFIYGSPGYHSDSALIQVTAINLDTYEVANKTFELTVDGTGERRYVVEIGVRNLDVGGLFGPAGRPDDGRTTHADVLVRKFQRLWAPQSDVVVVGVEAWAAVARMAVPAEAGRRIDDGVVVRLGGLNPFSDRLRIVDARIRASSACEEGREPQVNLRTRFEPEYEVDWCHYRLISPTVGGTAGSSDVYRRVPLEGAAGWTPPADEGAPRRDLQTEFIVTMAVPIGFGLLLLLTLSGVFFCGREGSEKRDRQTPDNQLQQYNAIQHSTTRLRHMSSLRASPRDAERTDAAVSSSLPRRSPPETTQAPPPYMLPPYYHRTPAP